MAKRKAAAPKVESLRYIGKTRNRRINGRPLTHGDIIDDPKEARDMASNADFEAVNSPPKPDPED